MLRALSRAAVPILAAAVSVSAAGPAVTFSDLKLKNGLRVIISENHAAPVFSVAVAYNVGSRDERAGRTGFAPLPRFWVGSRRPSGSRGPGRRRAARMGSIRSILPGRGP